MGRRRTFVALSGLTAGFVLAASAAGAQDPPSPAMEGRSIRLEDAVAIALRSDPAVMLAGQTVAERQGIVQQESGFFDATFRADGTFTFDQQELVGPRLEQERNRRLQLDVISRALAVTASELARGIQDEEGGSLLFQLECGEFQDRVVVDSPTGRIILCRNVQGEVVDVILAQGDGGFLDVTLFLELLDGLRDDLRDDLESFFLDILRQVAVTLDLTARALRLQFERLGPTPEEIQFLELDLLLAHQLRFRNGASLTASLSLNSTEENFAGKPLDPSFGDSTFPNTFTSAAGLSLNIPLARGRGVKATGAPELAAEAQLRAARELWLHTASERALAVVTAYWRLAAAQERLARLQESGKLQAELSGRVAELLERSEVTRIESNRAAARHAEVRSQVAAARRDVIVARFDLVTAMGLDARRLDQTPLAADPLPEDFPDLAPADDWVREAWNRRHDLRAAAEASEAGRILAAAARANSRPQVDLSFNASYNSLFETFEERLYELDGFVEAWEGEIAGPSYGFNLRWSLPFRNRAARGRLAQAKAFLSRSETAETDLKRTIRLRILDGVRTLEEAYRERVNLRTSLEHQEKTLEDSLELYELRELTFIDTLLTEEQLTGVRLALVDVERRIAETEARLRFESGRLLAAPAGVSEPDPDRLVLTDPMSVGSQR